MADEPAGDGVSRTRPASWYRRPQAIVGVLALLVPLGLAAALVIDALSVDPPPPPEPGTVEELPNERPAAPAPEQVPDADEGAEAAPEEGRPEEPAPRPLPTPEAGPEPEPEPPAEPEPGPTPPGEAEDRGPEPEPQRLSGNGSGRTPPLVHQGGLAVFTMRHRGQEAFGVAAEGEGRRVRLVNRTGDYDGSRAVVLPAGEYPLEITADGGWIVSLRQPRHEQGSALPVRFSGDGDRATAPLTAPGGRIRVRVQHEGEGAIIVRVLDAAGSRSRELVRARGPGSATRVGRVAEGLYLFDVQAAGPWSIEVRQEPAG